ncbi:MAG: electron-transferring-flavoprotein dehydrogenase [Acidobacteriota bacterium]|jgi:electron-transferring-flavoprotein dehydrogenase|nr:electron-transferring-flavoprotein dehydrogenase [Acidobacteriota bacterium]MDT7809417.1 electron-transferring-flavoprotein dehydrogenase [Acidobacteriota bacterium]
MERESIEMDVLFVGAGPASLSGALHLSRLVAEHNEAVAKGTRQGKSLGEIQIAVIEKGASIGAHILSGAVMDPKALRELIPDFIEQGAPVESEVKEDYFLYLTKTRAIKSPITPPPLKNHGYYIVSLNKLTAWLGEKCEEAGVNIFPEFPGAEMLYDERDSVVGVRTGDKGIDKEGRRKANFEPGVDILSKVTVLGEGPRGSLTKQLTERLGLNDGREPQVYSIGVKELWELPDDRYPAGRVTHTLGFPSDPNTYGGGWIYGMQNRIVNIGYVTGLDYQDPLLDPHAEFQRYKQHPFVAKLLEGGRMIRYGAKTIAAGGFYAIPQFHGDGFLLVGDSAGFLNSQRLKGIHTAIKSGMLAAQTIFEALLVEDYSKQQLKRYRQLVRESWITTELRRVRNFHAAFKHGRWLGLANAGLQFLTGGRSWGLFDRTSHESGHEAMKKLKDYGYRGDDISQRYGKLRFDNKLTFNKVTDVYHAAVSHDEDQPAHLHVLDTDICATRCVEEYANPCQRFCPAAVYEMVENGDGQRRLQINFSNCVHCKTCDIMDPYQIINWVTPEGGGGPDYKGM